MTESGLRERKSFSTLNEMFYFIKENYSYDNFINYRKDNSWKSISVDEFIESVEHLAAGLLSLGIKKGERIGIISNPSPFWVMADMAIALAGGITIPIFRRISPENLKFEIEQTELNFIFIGDPDEFDPVKQYCKRIKKIITIGFSRQDPLVESFENVISSGKTFIENNPDFKIRTFHKPAENDIFTIIYTSGSTGIPKGVMLTHKNIISQIHSAAEVFDLKTDSDIAMSSLPLSHIFERMVMHFYLSEGIRVYFVDDLNKIGAYVQEIKPTIMTVVPRLLEKIFSKMQQSIEENGGLKRIIGLSAFKRAQIKKDASTPLDFLYDKLVFSKLKAAMGGQLRYVISGAAPLPVYIGKFFTNIGVPVYEGYGMTEASPVIAANNTEYKKAGTVGHPFPSVTVKIAEDGEVLAKGPNVMAGYYKNEKETLSTIDTSGFLHTGDLGKIDEDGFLVITGRKKELFKKSTGEYVPPIPIEQALLKLNIVDSAVVIAEQRKFVSCLIFPNFEEVERLKNSEGFSGTPLPEFLDSKFIHDRIQDHITKVNKHLHHTEEIQKFTIIKNPISVETGELTPTMKIRRYVIDELYKNEIDAMYRN